MTDNLIGLIYLEGSHQKYHFNDAKEFLALALKIVYKHSETSLLGEEIERDKKLLNEIKNEEKL